MLRVFLETIDTADKNTVDKIKKLLSDNFESSSWKWSIESKLIARKQLPSESIDSYASDIMLWCRQTKKSEPETLSYFLRSLLPSLRAFVMAKQPETFRDALDAARLGISVQECDTPRPLNPPQIANVETPVNTLNSTLETLTNLVSHMSSRLDKLENQSKNLQSQSRNQQSSNHVQNIRPQNRQRPHRSVICFRCGFKGHKQASCYAIRDRDGRPLN